MRHDNEPAKSENLKKSHLLSSIGPYILVFLGFLVRGLNIGSLPPYIDEAANILTSIDREIRFSISPATLGRPLLAWLFFPPLLIRNQLFPELNILDVCRWYTSGAVLLTGILVVAVAFRTGGRMAAWVVAGIWAASPFLFYTVVLLFKIRFQALLS